MRALTSLQAESLACVRGGRLVFRDLAFAVEAGCALALEGANGAGKTSLLRLIAGFLTPAAGTIRLRTAEGTTVEDDEDRGRQIGWLGHHDGIKPQLTAAETLAFYARLYDRNGEVEMALAEVGLARAADLAGQYLSAGQKKRLALARLKMLGRPLWLMDEPLAALDTAGKALVAAMIARHCRDGGIAVIATHEALGLECAKLTLGAA